MNSISNSMYQITQILDDCQLHAGTDIAEQLGVSRTAVWKIVKRLKGFGVAIEGHHSGYQLQSPLDLLNAQRITQHTRRSPIKLEVFESIGSTNAYLKTCPPESIPHFCIAEMQTQGKGRLGRSWSSPFGCNIYASLSYPFHRDISELSGLSLVVAISLVKALKSYAPQTAFQIKWPNDLYTNGKKLGGILVEMIAEAHGHCRAIIGMGLNINMGRDTEIDQPWTTLSTLAGKHINRNELMAQIIDTVLHTLGNFQTSGLQGFMGEWKRLDALKGKNLVLRHMGQNISGIGQGIDKMGRLVMKTSATEHKSFSSGDTSIIEQAV